MVRARSPLSTANDRETSTSLPPQSISEAELEPRTTMPWHRMNLLYEAVTHYVEEAVLNALLVNQDMTGRDHHLSSALPHGPLLELIGR
ncbi:P1 family peptidase [Nocardia sp. CWNU-33]|uniref:P1 family peptidase n=1 Tax=Nocardia sp. CWNU-33 TaxID=3392117 RepID=UPI00398F6017